MNALKDIKLLYKDKTLILNKVILDKIKLYLDKEKIIKAAGVDTKSHLKEIIAK